VTEHPTTRPPEQAPASEAPASPAAPSSSVLIAVDIADCESVLLDDLLRLSRQADAAGRPLTLADCADLYAKREDVGRAYAGDADPEHTLQAGLLRRSIRVRSLTLCSPTLAALIRSRQPLEEHWAFDPTLLRLHGLYCVANAYDEAALDRLSTRSGALAALAEFAPRCTITPAESDYLILALGWETFPAAAQGKKKAHGTPPESSSTSPGPVPPETPATGSTPCPPVTPPGSPVPSRSPTAAVPLPSPVPQAAASPRIPTAPESPPLPNTPRPSAAFTADSAP